MIEPVVIAYLNDKLGIDVAGEKLAGIEKMVVVSRVGSGVDNMIDSVMLSFQSYDTTKAKACALNDLVKEAINSMPDELDKISECKLNSDYDFTDTAKKGSRWQCVFDITYYE
jgi:hypothetical protein